MSTKKLCKIWKFFSAAATFFQLALLMQEGELELRADLVSFLLLLLEVLLQLVCGETHFGVAASVWSPMRSQPGTLQTLGCSGPTPARVLHHTVPLFSIIHTELSGLELNSHFEWVGGKNGSLTRICCWGYSSWSSRLPPTVQGNNGQTGSSLSWCCGLVPSQARPGRGCQHSAWWKKSVQKVASINAANITR